MAEIVETEGAGCAKAAPLQGRIHTFGCAELASAEREVIMRPHSMQGVSLSVSQCPSKIPEAASLLSAPGGLFL